MKYSTVVAVVTLSVIRSTQLQNTTSEKSCDVIIQPLIPSLQLCKINYAYIGILYMSFNILTK